MKRLDCKGMACPAPVVAVKRSLEEMSGEEALEVLLDPGAPVENVTRFAANRGYAVTEKVLVGGVTLVISRGQGESPSVPSSKEVQVGARSTGKRVILVTSDRLGEGPEELGSLLMKNFIITLLDVPLSPDVIFFLNRGVLLTTEGSEVLDALSELGNRGVEVLSCGVCLDFFHRKEKLCAGAVTNMFTIAETLQHAVSVVRL